MTFSLKTGNFAKMGEFTKSKLKNVNEPTFLLYILLKKKKTIGGA